MSVVLREYLKRPRLSGELGIEIEVESAENLPINPPWPWSAKPDHSLRGKKFTTPEAPDPTSMEYVTTSPITYLSGMKLALIKRLTDVLSDRKYSVDANSPRTSVHVHVNVLELTPLQIWTAVFTYFTIENVLMELCGEERKGNMFCLRLKDAEGIIQTIRIELMQTTPFNYMYTDEMRYLGVNLKSVYGLGSLEFRGHPGTIDPIKINNWSTICWDIVDKSKRWTTPEEVLDYYQKQGANNFLAALTNYTTFELLKKDNIQALCDESVEIIADLVYSTEWMRWQTSCEERIKKKKDVRQFNNPEQIIADDVALPQGAPRRRARAQFTETPFGER